MDKNANSWTGRFNFCWQELFPVFLYIYYEFKTTGNKNVGSIERFHSRGQQPCKFIGTKGSIYKRKELNSLRTGLVHQHGRRFIVLEHQYGCRDVM